MINHSDRMSGGPLAGMRILDLTIALAGPYGTRILADLGADVIKVATRAHKNFETRLNLAALLQGLYPNAEPGTEPWNSTGPNGQLNRNKRSIALELGSKEGRESFLELVATADCIVENFTPKVMPSLGLGFETLSAVNPSLVYVAMPGFGSSGPSSSFPAFAPTTEAASGFLSLLGYRDGSRAPNPMSLADYVGGLNAMVGALACLRVAQKTGEGAFVDLSQVEAMATFIGEEYINSDKHAESPFQANRVPGSLVSGVFPTLGFDEWIAFSIYDDMQFAALSEIAEHNWLHDEKYKGRPLSDDAWNALETEIAAWTVEHDKYALTRILQGAGIPAGPVQTAPELLSDQQLNALDFFISAADPSGHEFPYEGWAWHSPEWPRRTPAPAPRLGEHTTEILAELAEMKAQRESP